MKRRSLFYVLSSLLADLELVEQPLDFLLVGLSEAHEVPQKVEEAALVVVGEHGALRMAEDLLVVGPLVSPQEGLQKLAEGPIPVPGGGIPSFDISSIFFDKGEDGVYVFDAESYPDVWPELSSFDPMNAESLQVVSVEIGEDEVVFKATGFIYTYAITYSKIGEVTPLDLEIPEDLDYLRISDAWSIADIKGIFGLSALSDENASAILDQVPIDLFHGNPGIYTFSDNTGASFPAIGYEFVAETQDEALMWVNGEFVSFVDTMLADDGYTMDYDTFAYYKEVTIGEDVYRIDVTYSIALSEKENTYIVAYIPNIALVK